MQPAPATAGQLRDLAEFAWQQSPGHFGGALSKVLVSRDNGAKRLDFRISTYQPGAHVESHAHPDKEQVYYFLSGTGRLELGDQAVIVRADSFAHIPPHLPHALENTGLGDLTFLVITVPLGDGTP